MDGRKLLSFKATCSAQISPTGNSPLTYHLFPSDGLEALWTSWEEDMASTLLPDKRGGREEVLSPCPRLLPAQRVFLSICGWTACLEQNAFLSFCLTWSWRRCPILRARLVWMRSTVKLDPRSLQLIFQTLQSTKRETFVQISRILRAPVNRLCLLIFSLTMTLG